MKLKPINYLDKFPCIPCIYHTRNCKRLFCTVQGIRWWTKSRNPLL